jgi:hypothetical protein
MGPKKRVCLLLFSLCSALAACGPALERSRVEGRFQAMFHCSNSHLSREVGGYRVEGCGTVAHFRCIDTSGGHFFSHHDDDVVGAVGALIDLGTRADPCLLEHSERPELRSGSLAGSSTQPAVRRAEDGPRLQSEVLFAGGHLSLLGKPARHPGVVLLTWNSFGRLAAEPCSIALFIDGTPVAVKQSQRVSDHLLRLLIRAEELRGSASATRIAGSACGQSFELDAHGRETLGSFEARFREEQAKISDGASNSI